MREYRDLKAYACSGVTTNQNVTKTYETRPSLPPSPPPLPPYLRITSRCSSPSAVLTCLIAVVLFRSHFGS